MEGCPKLLNLIPKDREWHVREKEGRHGVSDEKKLELRLGPPGETDQSLLSLAHFSSISCNSHNNNNNFHGAKRGFQDTVEVKTKERNWLTNSTEIQCQKLSSTERPVEKLISSTWSSGPLPSSTFSACQKESQKVQQQQSKPSFLQLQYPLMSKSLAVMVEKSCKPCSTRVAELQYPDKKACSTPAKLTVSANTAVPNSSHKRVAPAPVVGWPPIRSFRKNLVYGSSLKPASESPSDIPKVATDNKSESFRNDLFIKINMDGVPIGRKVDLKAYESYEKLSSAVDELFRAQRDFSDAGGENNMEEATITGLLDGNGEYTLVYEDNEGDRMLVGDVPWHMFVSTVKRLRVLKRSELSALCLCSSKQEKTSMDSAMEFGR